MIDDLLKSAKETIAERLASPFLGSFSVAWCLFNYKFIIIIFSANTVTMTFKLVEAIAFPDLFSIATRGSIYPLTVALLYVFAYPYPARYIYGFTQRRQKETNELRRQIKDETPLTLEESRTLRAEYIELERKHVESIDRLNSDVSRLALELNQTKPTVADSSSDIAEQLYGRLEPTQLELLQILEREGGVALEPLLLEKSTESKVKTEFDIGELEKRNLIHKNYDQREGEYNYKFTHDGRKALLNDGKVGA